MDHLGALGTREAWDFWPLLLVVAGLTHVVGLCDSTHRIGGIILMGVGALLLGHTLDAFDVRWDLLWPSGVIVLGLYLVYAVFRHRRHRADNPASPGVVDGWAVMGGREDRNDSPEFEGGEVSAVMGSYELDLSRAGMKGDEVHLYAKAVMGSVEIRVPREWRVTVRGTPVLGSVEDRTGKNGEDAAERKNLILHASAVLGSVEIRD
jgi:predicted membrane protein